MVNVSVEYYNKEEEKLFKDYLNTSEISSFTGRQQRISKDELIAYMMFTEQKDNDGFRTYQELQAKINHRLGDIDDYFCFTEGNLTARYTGSQMDKNLIERFGVGIGLSVINKLHNLTEADWKKITELAGPNGKRTFDFDIKISSDGCKFIQVENKGSAVKNNSIKTSTISNHRKSIKDKKEAQQADISPIKNLFYGTIGVIDNRPKNTVKLLLVDPPSFNIDYDPHKYKLLARLLFYKDEFKAIGVNKKLIHALEKRINEIAEASDIKKFDNQQIDYNYPQSFQTFIESGMLATINQGEAIGKFYFLEDEQGIYPYVIAFPEKLIELIIYQKFKEILIYKYEQVELKRKVYAVISMSRKLKIGRTSSEENDYVIDEREKYFERYYSSKLSYTSSGRIFGELS